MKKKPPMKVFAIVKAIRRRASSTRKQGTEPAGRRDAHCNDTTV